MNGLILNLSLLAFIVLQQACVPTQTSANVVNEKIATQRDLCLRPVNDQTNQTDAMISRGESSELRDILSDFVATQFFTSEETVFNFLKLTYQTFDAALTNYKKEKNLNNAAIVILFKGNNIARLVVQETIDQLKSEARAFLQKEYLPFFKRADAIFNVFVDEEKLGNLDYDRTLAEVADLVAEQTTIIRDTMANDPYRYFDFLRLNNDSQVHALKLLLNRISHMRTLRNQENKTWNSARNFSIQLRDITTLPTQCTYSGQRDYRVDHNRSEKQTKITSSEPHFMYVIDHRHIDAWHDAVRIPHHELHAKIAFDVRYDQDNVSKRKIFGGDLLSVRIVHRSDPNLREVLDELDNSTAEYTLINESNDERFRLRGVTPFVLVNELEASLFEFEKRPWERGYRYIRKINQNSFLNLMSVIHQYGLSDRMDEFLSDVQNTVIARLHDLFDPEQRNPQETYKKAKAEYQRISHDHRRLVTYNAFFTRFFAFISHMVKAPLPSDNERFVDMLEAIEKHFVIGRQLIKINRAKPSPENFYEMSTRDLF